MNDRFKRTTTVNLSISLRTSERDLENASVEKIHIPILIEYYI